MLTERNKKKFEQLISECKKNLKRVDEHLILKAFEFSLYAHKGALRASGESFFEHPYEVAKITASEIPFDDYSVVCALLHDVVEDTDYKLDAIKKEFGDKITEIVDGLTKIDNVFGDRSISQAENFRKFLLSMFGDVRVLIVKFADRLHNMRTIEPLIEEKKIRLANETLEIYAPLANRFGLGKVKSELEDLAFKYLEPSVYNKINSYIRSTKENREKYIKKFITPIEKKLKQFNYDFTIEGRPKYIYSIHKKMFQSGKPIEEIYDLFAIRIILNTEDKQLCYAVHGHVLDLYNSVPQGELYKDYISRPKSNNYQSLHFTVFGVEGKMVEIQIRTKEMHEKNEMGIAAHWKYKENVQEVDKNLENWINHIREILEHKNEYSSSEALENVKLNLYQDEIYVFTPKGDLKILPKNATAIDFAFEIHSDVGFHTIGAKVNGRIVPLNTILRSGDQVEIITSKKQIPNRDWEKFAITHKAKTHIRRYLKDEERKLIDAGKEMWEKKMKKAKLHVNDDELTEFVHTKRFDNLQAFYLAIKNEEVDADVVVSELTDRSKNPQSEAKPDTAVSSDSIFNKFVDTARSITSGISIFGTKGNLLYGYAKCCNPIPGDDIVGYVTTGEGIKIHRKNCRNVQSMLNNGEERIVHVEWPEATASDFIAGIRISGNDRSGLLNDVTNAISNYENTNIRSVNINTKDSLFDGQFVVYVKNTTHLNNIIDRLKRLKNITKVERFDE